MARASLLTRPAAAAVALLLVAVLLTCAAGGASAARIRRVKPSRAMAAAAKRTLIVVYKPGAASDANIAAASAALQGGSLAAARVGPLMRICDDFAAHAVELPPGADAASGAALALAQLLPSGAAAAMGAAGVSIAADSPLRTEAARLRDLGVDYIEADRIATAAGTQGPFPAAPWGLDRIDQREPLGSDHVFNFYNSSGAGVRVYVIDSGVNIGHIDFGGRAVYGKNTITNTLSSPDENGHGTAVAGVIGGIKYGVAKNATLVAVKVLDSTGSGTLSGIIDGINWAVSNCKAQPAPRRCVINLSLSMLKSTALNSAVAAAYTNGMIAVAAAGNKAGSACNQSPGSEPNALTVYATDSKDRLESTSNHGPCTDLGAPGVSIESDSYQCPGGTCHVTLDGTSLSAAHVSGAAALVWGQFAASASNSAVIAALVNQATAGAVQLGGASTTPNKLLYTSLASL